MDRELSACLSSTNFSDLSEIPRPSKHEARVLTWLKGFADERSLEWRQDDTGNCVICRPGSGGGEGAATVVIQGHVDMVGGRLRG